MKHEESKLQIMCVKWFRFNYPKLARLLFAVPNGGKRSLITAKLLKAEGVLSGVADLVLLKPTENYHGLCIEMKIKPNKQTDTQKEWQKDVEDSGFKYIVCYSFEDFEAKIKEYLC